MKADGILVCYMCEGTAHDVIMEQGRRSLLSCAYCNVSEWTDKRPVETKKKGFVLRHGRHAGKTLEEVSAEPRGNEYLKCLAANDEKLREVISEHLAAAPQA